MTSAPAGKLCPQCRKRTLKGEAADQHDGTLWPARADPKPIDALGEAIARLAGRLTYDLDHDGKLHIRSTWHIRQTRRRPVLAEHRCGRPLPAAAPGTPGLPQPDDNNEEKIPF